MTVDLTNQLNTMRDLLMSITRYDAHTVFNDFCVISASKLADYIDPAEKKYTKDEMKIFAHAFGELTAACSYSLKANRFEDVLGKLFHTMEFHAKALGQFFTGQHVADMMATMIAAGNGEIIEPSCGSGVNVLAAASAMAQRGGNPQRDLRIHAMDLDYRCVCMAFVQFSLYGLTAKVTHGNSLTNEVFKVLYTPSWYLEFLGLRR